MSEVFKATIKLTAVQVANLIRERFGIPADRPITFNVDHTDDRALVSSSFTSASFECDIPDPLTAGAVTLKYPPGVRGRDSGFPDR